MVLSFLLKNYASANHWLAQQKVSRWLHEIDANCDVVNRILVGNKNDDPDRKVIEQKSREHFCIQFFRLCWRRMPGDLQTKWEFSCLRLLPRTTSMWRRCSGPSPPWSSSPRRTRRSDLMIRQKSTLQKAGIPGQARRRIRKASAANNDKLDRLFLSWQIRFSDFYCTILIKMLGVCSRASKMVNSKLLCGSCMIITWHSNCPIKGLFSEHCKVGHYIRVISRPSIWRGTKRLDVWTQAILHRFVLVANSWLTA